MALVSIEHVAQDANLGLWQMTESEEQLLSDYPFLPYSLIENVKSRQRRLELLSVRALLFLMTHNPSLVITHNRNGAPLVDGYQIGISHTRGYAAVILSKQSRAVSVDIEYMSDRVGRIADRFIRKDEQCDGLERQLIIWSAKETVYKLCQDTPLRFEDMRLHPFDVADGGTVDVDNLLSGEVLKVAYRLTPDYVLTYSVV